AEEVGMPRKTHLLFSAQVPLVLHQCPPVPILLAQLGHADAGPIELCQCRAASQGIFEGLVVLLNPLTVQPLEKVDDR
ncbi:MAG: hypothetical protein R6X06_00455, partial [Gammaproteobacteria bacterium]